MCSAVVFDSAPSKLDPVKPHLDQHARRQPRERRLFQEIHSLGDEGSDSVSALPRPPKPTREPLPPARPNVRDLDRPPANHCGRFAEAYAAGTESNLPHGCYARPAILDLAGDRPGRSRIRDIGCGAGPC